MILFFPSLLGLAAKEFLDRSATQLTVHGLMELHRVLSNSQACVFFRNNHFSTLYKSDVSTPAFPSCFSVHSCHPHFDVCFCMRSLPLICSRHTLYTVKALTFTLFLRLRIKDVINVLAHLLLVVRASLSLSVVD